MLFFTLFFTVVYAVFLFRGHSGNRSVQYGELELKKYEVGSNISEIEKAQLKLSVYYLWIFILMITQVFYLLSAVEHDPYKYPTLVILAHIIYKVIKSLVSRKSKKPDLTTEEGKIEFRKILYSKQNLFYNIIVRILYLTYFAYMLYNIVFN